MDLVRGERSAEREPAQGRGPVCGGTRLAARSKPNWSSLQTIGVGLGFRTPFKADPFLRRDSVDFLEITADHYLGARSERERELALLAEHFTLIPHGLNLSLGSALALDREYVRKLTGLVRRLDPPWWSEHIAFTRAPGRDIGQLSPLPYTREALDAPCRNVAEVRRQLDVPLILENISYVVAVPGAEMSEAEFLAEVIERTGCGLLLDVMNLHPNAVNHGYDPWQFLDRLPLEHVVQIHFVGGHWSGEVLVDSHSESTPPEVWDLLDEVLRRAPVKSAILGRGESAAGTPGWSPGARPGSPRAADGRPPAPGARAGGGRASAVDEAGQANPAERRPNRFGGRADRTRVGDVEDQRHQLGGAGSTKCPDVSVAPDARGHAVPAPIQGERGGSADAAGRHR